MNDRKMKSSPNSLANLEKGREVRKKNAIRSTFSLRPDTVAFLKKLPNMSAALDKMVDYIVSNSLRTSIFPDELWWIKEECTLVSKDMNDRRERLQLQSQDTNDRSEELQLQSQDMKDRIKAVESELAEVRSQLSAQTVKYEQEAIEHANAKGYITRLERERTEAEADTKSAIAALKTLIAKPSNQGRVSKAELERVVSLLGG